jgi:hypothetical protein
MMADWVNPEVRPRPVAVRTALRNFIGGAEASIDRVIDHNLLGGMQLVF